MLILIWFERFQRTGGYWRFAGRLHFHEFKIEQRTDKTGNPRQAIVFGLLAVPNEAVSPKVFDDILKPYSPELFYPHLLCGRRLSGCVEAYWVHGRVVHSLATTLTALGHVPKKSQAVDLALLDDSGSTAVVFEAKTDTDPYSVYALVIGWSRSDDPPTSFSFERSWSSHRCRKLTLRGSRCSELPC